jgi:hypothetical protein
VFLLSTSVARAAAGITAALALTASPAFHPASAAELPRADVVLASAISVDPDAGTVVLPLYEGMSGGKRVEYIITESSDKADAEKRKVNFAPGIKDAFLQKVTLPGGVPTFEGAPDFSPSRVYTASATGFPPSAAKPGATADSAYSPFVKLPSGVVLNAPIVATGDGPYDVTTHADTQERVLAIDTTKHTVTLLLARGFFNGKQIVYLSTEASDPGAASIERATFVPNLNKSGSGSEAPIVAIANGRTGSDSQVQGIAHAALDEHLDQDATLANATTLGSPLNVLSVFPGTPAYTPLWNAFIGVWSNAATSAHKNVRLTALAQAFAASSAHELTGPDGKAFGPVGFVVNCPVIGTLPASATSQISRPYFAGFTNDGIMLPSNP